MIRSALVVLTALVIADVATATTLPVGPITFSTNADYDNNFKESPSYTGGTRTSPGMISLSGSPSAVALYDTSATGGSGGSGGTGGGRANIDFTDFIISADISSTNLAAVGGGFLLRFNSADAGGYYASAHTISPTAVEFQVIEGASLISGSFPIFDQVVGMSNVVVMPGVYYHFAVKLVGGKFDFDFANGAAKASYTDTTVTATVGQVGFDIDCPSPVDIAFLDNFAVEAVPEPSTLVLSAIAAVALGLSYGRAVVKQRRAA